MTITSSVSFRVRSAVGGSCFRESSGHTQSSKREVNGVWIMKHLKKLEEEVAGWPHISVHPHRFGGREFRFLSAELGHVHTGGIVDIPARFTMRSWRKVWLRNIAGFPTQVGSLSAFAVRKT